jgi:Zn-dependent peptidase ImmA (M78 family)
MIPRRNLRKQESGEHQPETPQQHLINVNPEMIVLARLASGQTQTECADRIGISQAKLCKLEDSLTTTIRSESLAKLAELTGYPTDFFIQPGHRQSLGEGFFRKRASLPAKVANRMEALVNIKRMEISKLVHKIEIEHKERPAWDTDDFKGGAREIARHLRHYWNIPNGPIKDLVEIVEDAGCVVLFFDFGTPKIDGLTVYCDNGVPLMLLNPNVSYVRQRATLSHELGHVIMHRMPNGNMEKEAFEFASEFMMPEQEIRPAMFPMNLERVARLKIKWRTSMQWILKWANSIGALSDSYYRVLMMKISRNGWRKIEPHDEWQLEKPALFDDCVSYYRNDLGYAAQELCVALKANTRTFMVEYFKAPTFVVV